MMSQERVARAIVERHGIPLPQAARIARAAAGRHRAWSPSLSAMPAALTPPPTPVEPQPLLTPTPRPITREELARAISIVSSVSLDDASLIADGVLANWVARR